MIGHTLSPEQLSTLFSMEKPQASTVSFVQWPPSMLKQATRLTQQQGLQQPKRTKPYVT